MAPSRGEITVFLSLLLSMVLLGVGALTELARATVIKSQIELDMGNAMTSALAEYNRPMLEKYNIFLLDAAYGRENINTKLLTDRLKEYMSGAKGESGSLLGYRINSLAADELVFATDNCGQAIYDQIIDYMKKKYLLDLANELTDYENALNSYRQKKQLREAREEANLPENVTAGIGLFEGISNLLKANKMGQVLDLMPVSDRILDREQVLSCRRRDLFQGASIESPSIGDKFLFNKYLLDNFKHCIFTNNVPEGEGQRETSAIEYELEYLVAGKLKDRDNLSEVIDRLVIFRELFNLAYIETDSARVSEAASMATTLLAITANPELIEAGKHIILAAWAHAEAICDVRSLLAGQKVALNKSQANWHTQMSAILFPKTTGTYPSDSGFTYKDYLNLLLLMENSADLSIRTMDLMEANIRLKEHYNSFSMDNCLAGFGVRGQFDMKHILASIQPSNYKYEGKMSYEDLKG